MNIEELHIRGDYLTQMELVHSLRGVFTFIKRDFLLDRRTPEFKSLKKMLLDSSSKAVISGMSDISFNLRDARKFRKLFPDANLAVTNLETATDESLQTFPIGLTDPIKGSYIHSIFGDKSMLRKAWESRSGTSNVLLASFSKRTHHSRYSAMMHSIRSKYVHIEPYSVSESGRLNVLKKSSESLGVVCPRGNGLDTHRIWETLMMGSIPIVKVGQYPKDILESTNMRHLVVRSWKELQHPEIIDKLLWVQGQIPSTAFPLTTEFWIERLITKLSRERRSY